MDAPSADTRMDVGTPIGIAHAPSCRAWRRCLARDAAREQQAAPASVNACWNWLSTHVSTSLAVGVFLQRGRNHRHRFTDGVVVAEVGEHERVGTVEGSDAETGVMSVTCVASIARKICTVCGQVVLSVGAVGMREHVDDEAPCREHIA